MQLLAATFVAMKLAEHVTAVRAEDNRTALTHVQRDGTKST